MVSYKII